MAHDVFISYSSKDKPIADAACANLEGSGIRCWIAPRDIVPGEDWPTAITRAIAQSRVMVLIFSANSNASDDVSRELMLAANCKLVIVPFKIENIEPEPGKQYYLARTHWLDAINPPTQQQIHELVDCVSKLVPAQKSADTTSTVQATQPGWMPLQSPSAEQEAVKRKRTSRAWILGAGAGFLLLAGTIFAVLLFITHRLDFPTLKAGTSPTISPTIARNAATAPASPGPTATFDFSANAGIAGTRIFNGPGEDYTQIDFTFNNMIIIGQMNDCDWLQVKYDGFSRSQQNWAKSDEVTYSVACSAIPAAAAGFVPAATRTSSVKCKVDKYFNVKNDTGGQAEITLKGPAFFDFKLPPGTSTFNICRGTYTYTFSMGGCGSKNILTGTIFDGGTLSFYCK